MTQDRKTFGMTAAQLGILAGLAGLVCLLFGITGWLVFRGSFNLPFSQGPVNTLAPQVTATPFAIPTITPTGIPTPIPYEQLIPDGWTQHRTTLVELWLPPKFKPEGSELLGDTASLAIPELIFSGSASKSSLYRMVVAVSYEPLAGDSLNTYLDSELTKLPPEARVVERRKVLVNTTEAIRLTFEIRSNNVDINDLAYVFLDGSTVWYVEYAAQINEFYEMLPTFEESVLTFRVVR